MTSILKGLLEISAMASLMIVIIMAIRKGMSRRINTVQLWGYET